MDNIIKAIAEFPTIDLDDETNRLTLKALIEIPVSHNSSGSSRKFSQLDLLQLEKVIYYANHRRYISVLAEAVFDMLSQYIAELLPTLSADLLLPLTIELLPDDESLLKEALSKLKMTFKLGVNGKLAYIFVTLASAIEYKLLTPDHTEITRNDPHSSLLLNYITMIKDKLMQIEIVPENNIASIIETIKLQNKNHEYVIKWLEIAWREYQIVMNDTLFQSLRRTGQFQDELQTRNDLDSYILKYAPTLYKGSILQNEINLYFITTDMKYTLNRSSTSFTDRLIEFNEKLDYHQHQLKDHEILKVIKYNLGKLNIGAISNELHESSLLDYLPSINYRSVLPFSLFNLSNEIEEAEIINKNQEDIKFSSVHDKI